MSNASDFLAALKPASFRGVPFGVTESRKTFGRRVVDHEYPFRDQQWVEDLGRAGRRIGITGFLVSNSLVYGGGSVLDQELALVAAAETKGQGTLVHPTLGELTVSCLSCSTIDQLDSLGVIAIELDFLEAGEKVFPSVSTATTTATNSAADTADTAASSDLSTEATPLLAQGAVVAQSALSTVTAWVDQAQSLATDATSLFNLASQLPGDYGRYFNGANLGLASSLLDLLPAGTTIASLVALAANDRQLVNEAATTVLTTAANLGLGASSASPTDLATASQALTAQLLAVCANPADAVRLLSALATYAPNGAAALTSIGVAVGDLFRRAAVAALARASASYQPWSYDDAAAVRSAVTALIDAEIQIAGDEGEDATFNALRSLRVAVVQDLTARGASLAPLATFSEGANLPAIVLAQRLYRDPSRGDQLVGEVNPVHPLFMPRSFRALAA
ncbi:MAG: DNA circularization N-terminal domain-containing protein [Caulobacteraceae bacterium]|nr:DNA circularization N-terminal domain-containing protein [Caulobacteraceae bacterium]